MSWDLKEAVDYYRRQGAPGDQNALRGLLTEIQTESGGAIPKHLLAEAADGLGVKESFLAAIIKRVPSLRLRDHHILEICAGPNCTKKWHPPQITDGRVEVRYVSCMRLCGKGPNIRFDGKLYHKADAELLKRLLDEL